MRLVLILLVTCLQSPFNFLNLQDLIGTYALNNSHWRQMLAIVAVYRHRQRQRRRRNWQSRYWCLRQPQQSWFKIYYNDHRIPDDYFKQQLLVCRETFNELLNMVSTQAEAEKKTKLTIEILVFTAATTIMVQDIL